MRIIYRPDLSRDKVRKFLIYLVLFVLILVVARCCF